MHGKKKNVDKSISNIFWQSYTKQHAHQLQSSALLSGSTPGSRCLGTAYSLSEFLCTKQTAALSTSSCKGKCALESGGGESF